MARTLLDTIRAAVGEVLLRYRLHGSALSSPVIRRDIEREAAEQIKEEIKPWLKVGLKVGLKSGLKTKPGKKK